MESAFGSDRFVVSYLPLALVALLVAAFAAASTRAAQRGDAERLVAIGLRRSTVSATQTIAIAAAAAVATAGGLALGWAIAAALRAGVLYRLANQPLSPIPAPPTALLAIAATTVVAIAIATAWPGRLSPRRASPAAGASSPLAWARRVVVGVAVIAAYRAGGGIYSVAASYLAITAVLLAAPDVLALAVRALPRTRPRAMVTAAMMRADLRRQAVALVVVGACIAVPVCAGTQLVSRAASDNTFGFAGVPAGQLWVQGRGQDPAQDVDGVASVVASTPGIDAPVVIENPQSPGTYADPDYLSASFTTTPLTGSASFTIMVIDSADQLRTLLGPALPTSAEKTLAGGGVIDFTRTRGDQSFTIAGAAATNQRTTATLPTARFRPGKVWRGTYGGVVLRSTARSIGLPLGGQKSYYFTGVTQPQTTAAVAAAVAAGYDAAFVQYHVEPFPQRVPAAAYVFLAALVLGAFGVLLLIVGSQATRLRAYSARLVAIGLTPRWTRGILTTQAALTVGIGLAAGTIAGLLGIMITADHYARLVIPTTPITITVIATVAAAALATRLAARRLSATERTEVT